MVAHRWREDHQKADWRVLDPGDGNSIDTRYSGVCEIVTADAETRTLPDPTYLGQKLTIHMQTDEGDCVITASTAINQTGNNTITLGAVDDLIVLESVEVSSGTYKWRVTGNDGAALSTV